MAKNTKFTKGLIFIISLILFSFALGDAPVHLNQDELMFGLNAKSIATTGRDYYGNSMPFYFWHLGSFWATPIIVYLTSIFLKFLPLAESTISMSSVFVGTISIYLIMVLVEKLFKDRRLTIVSGVLATITPVLFINSRLLLDNVYTIPFVLYGIFRYLYLIYQVNEGGRPERVLLTDIPLIINIMCYIAVVGIILY